MLAEVCLHSVAEQWLVDRVQAPEHETSRREHLCAEVELHPSALQACVTSTVGNWCVICDLHLQNNMAANLNRTILLRFFVPPKHVLY